jgi:hypothetical protein
MHHGYQQILLRRHVSAVGGAPLAILWPSNLPMLPRRPPCVPPLDDYGRYIASAKEKMTDLLAESQPIHSRTLEVRDQ